MSPEYSEAQLTSAIEQINARLDLIEQNIETIAQTVGVAIARPSEGIPADVVELARAGDRMGAIKRYRAVTGTSLQDAQSAIDSL
jgi:ribosomal protein L7/L12